MDKPRLREVAIRFLEAGFLDEYLANITATRIWSEEAKGRTLAITEFKYWMESKVKKLSTLEKNP